MKKKILLPAGIALAALVVLAAIALLPFLSMLTGSGGAAGSYAQVVNLNWELDLPAEVTRLYETDSGSSFHGDGERYHVLGYSSSPEAALEQQTARLAVFPEEGRGAPGAPGGPGGAAAGPRGLPLVHRGGSGRRPEPALPGAGRRRPDAVCHRVLLLKAVRGGAYHGETAPDPDAGPRPGSAAGPGPPRGTTAVSPGSSPAAGTISRPASDVPAQNSGGHRIGVRRLAVGFIAPRSGTPGAGRTGGQKSSSSGCSLPQRGAFDLRPRAGLVVGDAGRRPVAL